MFESHQIPLRLNLFIPNDVINFIFSSYMYNDLIILDNNVYHVDSNYSEIEVTTINFANFSQYKDNFKFLPFDNIGKSTKIINFIIVCISRNNVLKFYHYKNILIKIRIFDMNVLRYEFNFHRMNLSSFYIWNSMSGYESFINYKNGKMDGDCYIYIDKKLSKKYKYEDDQIKEYKVYKNDKIERVYNFKDGKYHGDQIIFRLGHVVRCIDDYIYSVYDLSNKTTIKLANGNIQEFGDMKEIELEYKEYKLEEELESIKYEIGNFQLTEKDENKLQKILLSFKEIKDGMINEKKSKNLSLKKFFEGYDQKKQNESRRTNRSCRTYWMYRN